MFKRFLLFAALLMLVFTVPAVLYLGALPDVRQYTKINPQTSAIRTHREKQARARGRQPRSAMIWRKLDRISPHLINAVILAEDDRFFEHNGFDLTQIKNAFRENWARRRFAFGGSTLTQQLARTLYLSSHKNILRKAKEALIARRLEKALTKKRILELYLNVVEWGPQVYGAEAAAQFHFQKSAQDLTPEEAIALAVILPSPRKWKPMGESAFINRRKNILYERMIRAGHIVPEIPVLNEDESGL